jgi:S-(hydroxymethyl)glutathione dehydrogenase/alcohol dehydrogenase
VGIGRRDDVAEFNAAELFHSARTLRSSVYGSSDPDVDLPGLAARVCDGSLDVRGLVTHRGLLDDVPAAFGRMRDGVGARTLITLDPTIP